MPKELIQARNTRTGDARKIDEWKVRLPGGDHAKFDVGLFYKDGVSLFELKSDHPSFRDVTLKSEDLNSLRAELTDIAQHIIETNLSEDWTRACQMEIRHSLRDDRAQDRDLRFSLSINLHDVELHKERVASNIPLATVRDGYAQKQVVIRSHSDDFGILRPSSGSLMDPEVKDWLRHPVSNDEEKGLGRIVEPGNGDAQLDLVEALNAFSGELSARLSPDRVDREGFPKPEELLDLMQIAVSPSHTKEESFEP